MGELLVTFNSRFDLPRFIQACTPRHYVRTRLANAFDSAYVDALTKDAS